MHLYNIFTYITIVLYSLIISMCKHKTTPAPGMAAPCARFLRRFHTMQQILIESLASSGEGPYDMIARLQSRGHPSD